MKIPQKASDFKTVPEGTHLAVCNAIVDLGMQPGSQMYPAAKQQVYIRFEVPGEMIEHDGKEGPAVVGAFFTASMGKKAKLRQFIEGWFAKSFPSEDAASDFDLSMLIGKAALLNIVHNKSGDKTYANIKTAAPLIKGMEKPALQNEPISFYIAEWDDKEYAKVPEFLRKKIESRLRTPEEMAANNDFVGAYEDDNGFQVPF